jgi:hypothetical protein
VAGRGLLCTVSPDGGCVGDREVESREFSSAICNGVESRVKACEAVVVEFSARIFEGGLGHSVVLLLELENNGVSGKSGEEGRVESEFTGSTDDDSVNGASS